MRVLITSANGLTLAYGSDGCATVLGKLQDYIKIGAPAEVRILDDSISMQGGTIARSLDPADLRAALQPIASRLGVKDAIAIIGDQRIFPSFSVSNPVSDRSIDPDVAVALASHLNDGGLSAREAEVLTLVASGKSNKVIAGNLGLSEETIKGYLKSIMVKLGANDRTHAVTLAQRRGIIELDSL